MAEKILFGFGGCKFSAGTTTATFDGGIGKIAFSPIQLQAETVDHNIVSRLLGYRVTLDISELYNIESTDYVQYQYLATILSSLVYDSAQRTVTIKPRYDDDIANNLSYECILTSDFSPDDVHRVKTGQKLNLKFTCINKKTSIPTMVSDTETNNLIFNTNNAIFNSNNAIVQSY